MFDSIFVQLYISLVFCWLLFHKTKYEQRSVGSSSGTKKKRGNLKNDAIRRHYIVDHSFYFICCRRNSIIWISLCLLPALSTRSFYLLFAARICGSNRIVFLVIHYCHCFSNEHFLNFYCNSSSFVRSCPMHLFDCIALRDGVCVSC